MKPPGRLRLLVALACLAQPLGLVTVTSRGAGSQGRRANQLAWRGSNATAVAGGAGQQRAPKAALGAAAEGGIGPGTMATRLACFFREVVDLKAIHWLANPTVSLYEGLRTKSGRLRSRIGGKCAVISSSGVLRAYKHGPAIDSADTVIRFNDAPVRGFEEIVGSKDDLRFVNMHFPDLVLNDHFPVRPGVTYINVLTGRISKFMELAERRPGIDLYMADSQVMESVTQAIRQVFDSSWFSVGSDGFRDFPSTGALGMLIALSVCDEVRAYGMAATQKANWLYPYHYYEALSGFKAGFADNNTVHKSFDAEKQLWRLLARNPPAEMDSTDVAVIPGFSRAICPKRAAR